MFPIRDHNPSNTTPYVTWALIVLNVGIFLSYWDFAGEGDSAFYVFDRFALFPGMISDGLGWSGFITSMFLHGSILHLLGNMLFLYIFGDNLEDQFGHIGFLLFYLLTGCVAGLAHVAVDPLSMVPTVGASGAIAGVMGGYLLLFPKARIDILFILVIIFKVVPIPAVFALLTWFALQIFGGVSAQMGGGGVAYWAHAGGFVAGVIGVVPIWLARGGPAFWHRTHGHPPHPDAPPLRRSNIPRVPRK